MPSAPGTAPEPRNRTLRRRRRGALGLAILIAVAIATALALHSSGEKSFLIPDPPQATGDIEDPFRYDPTQRESFERRAAGGLAHVLFSKSPDGVMASAERTARYRDTVDAVAAANGVEADTLEGIILLESAGRADAIAGNDLNGAVGLAQIVATTGTSLLDMKVDVTRSEALTKRIAAGHLALERGYRTKVVVVKKPGKAKGRKRGRKVRKEVQVPLTPADIRQIEAEIPKLEKERATVDERFDPAKSIAGEGRYIVSARRVFGVNDLATVSYHMGIGNLENVVRSYAAPPKGSKVADVVAGKDLSYAQVYFDSSPRKHPQAWKLLSNFGDESSNYYWKVLAAREIMRLYRQDRGELERLVRLHSEKATAENVYHPEESTKTYESSDDIGSALEDGELARIPNDPRRLRYRIGAQLGELASKAGGDRELYASLRPEALATLLYIAREVEAIGGGDSSLILTSAVRDKRYQELLASENVEATPGYSLHTTGYAFDIQRKYGSNAQAQAFQFILDRLRALAVIDYAVEPNAIHVTVSDGGKALTGLLEP